MICIQLLVLTADLDSHHGSPAEDVVGEVERNFVFEAFSLQITPNFVHDLPPALQRGKVTLDHSVGVEKESTHGKMGAKVSLDA